MKKTCNQCGKSLSPLGAVVRLYSCFNPKCPNFALLQVAMEDVPVEKKNKKKN